MYMSCMHISNFKIHVLDGTVRPQTPYRNKSIPPNSPFSKFLSFEVYTCISDNRNWNLK